MHAKRYRPRLALCCSRFLQPALLGLTTADRLLVTFLSLFLTHLNALLGTIIPKASTWLIVPAAICGCLFEADGEAPSFTVGPYLQDVTEDSIIICWESDMSSDGTIEYWVKGTQTSSMIGFENAQRQEVQLTDLQPGTAYSYRVRIPAEGDGTFFSAGFKTAPVEDVPITFAVYGDTRGSGPNHRSVVEAMMAVDPAFVIHTGDLVTYGDSDFYWNIFWETVAPRPGEESLAGNYTIFPAVGNHEYISGTGGYKDESIVMYQSYFVLPPNGLESEYPEWTDRFYSFQYGAVFFILLDVNNDTDPDYDLNIPITEGPPDIHPGSPQYEWLINQLTFARDRFPFTFVCFHHPPYGTGPYGPGVAMKMRFLDPIFRQYGVDAVFNSHNHSYERCETYVENYRLLYLTEGAGGAPLYGRTPGWDEPGSWIWDELNQTFYTKAFDNSSYSFIKVDIVLLGNNAWRATFSATRPDGEVFDVVQIRRPWSHIELGETLTFSFESTPGKTYQVEYTNDFLGSENEWQPLGSPIIAEASFIHVTDDGTLTGANPADDTVSCRFYRAVELP